MGTRGPIGRTSSETKRLGNPGKRAMKDAVEVTQGRLPTAPDPDLGLADAGTMLWVHVAALPWVTASDAALLARMCRLADLLDQLEAQILADGIAYESRGRLYAHPVLNHRHEVEKRLSVYMGAFGLSPADRTRLGIAEVKAQSKFDELLAKREARREERA